MPFIAPDCPISRDGVRVVIVDHPRKSTLIGINWGRPNDIEVYLMATDKDNIYAELAALTAKAVQFYEKVRKERGYQ